MFRCENNTYRKCHKNVRSSFSGWWGKQSRVGAEDQSFKLGSCCTLGDCRPKAVTAVGRAFPGWVILFGDGVTTLLEKLRYKCRKLLVARLRWWLRTLIINGTSYSCGLCCPSWIRVTAEVKHNPTNTIVCKAQGEWNGSLEFTYSSGETKVIDTHRLPVIRKKIRPIAKQGLLESR